MHSIQSQLARIMQGTPLPQHDFAQVKRDYDEAMALEAAEQAEKDEAAKAERDHEASQDACWEARAERENGDE